MKTDFTNFTGSQAAENQSDKVRSKDGIFRLNTAKRETKGNNQISRRRDMMKERIAEREREMQQRELENLRIKELNEQIAKIHADDDISDEVKMMSIEMLNEQISQIHTARMEREQLAIERELQRQQAEMDERMRERERNVKENKNNKPKTEEELEEAKERSQIHHMTVMSAQIDNINTLSQTRARLSAAATRLRGEAEYDSIRQKIANDEILANARRYNMEIATQTGKPMEVSFLFSHNPLSEDGFRGRHLAKLEEGISRTTSTINNNIGALYRESKKLQEEQLKIYREQSRIPSEDEGDNEEKETQGFDMRL